MSRMKFFIVDVFATVKFSGNQVAIIECDNPLEVELMQKIAREISLPEVSFVQNLPNPDGSYNVRIFTPEREVSFSGHPTLGTAFIIHNYLSSEKKDEIILNLPSGHVSIEVSQFDSSFVSKNKPCLLSAQKNPEFGRIYEPVLLSKILGLEPQDIDTNFPIQEITVGLPFIIVPLKNLEILKQIRINIERYNWLIQRTKAKLLLVFCAETENPENNMHVRVFANYYGIPEDSATGSGNGGLAAYLAKYRYFGQNNVDIRIEQGYEIGRPSLILAKAQIKSDNIIDVSIGGLINLVVEGEIL
ncbi:MAG: PhzF family phenazine biosynthesis protein [Promethearchaeota archaeon]